MKEKNYIKTVRYPPGDFAIWIVIYVELVTFGALFLTYAYKRHLDVELFNESQLMLNQLAGFVNTIVLITSSYLVVRAVEIIKKDKMGVNFKQASNFLSGAIILGIVFLVIKISEFYSKYAEGINMSTNTFFMFYFILTVFHFLHVLLGVIILYNLYAKTKTGGYNISNYAGLETGASYWHMVDLLWIVLFPLIYIIR